MRVVVMMVDRPEVAVLCRVSLAQHVRSDEVGRLGVQRVSWLRRRRLDV